MAPSGEEVVQSADMPGTDSCRRVSSVSDVGSEFREKSVTFTDSSQGHPSKPSGKQTAKTVGLQEGDNS